MLSNRRALIALAAAASLALHLGAAATGGLIDPRETALAAAGAGQGAPELGRPAAPGETVLAAPVASWLADAGAAVLGASTIGARAPSAVLSALLLLGCFVVLLRAQGPRFAALVTLAMATVPAWVLTCGQVGAPTVAVGAVLLAVCCQVALATTPDDARPPRWLAAALGGATGLAAIVAGPAAAAIPAFAVLADLAIAGRDAKDRATGHPWLAPALAALAGAALLALGLAHGRQGWPTAASLGLVACEGERGAGLAWAGAALLAAALVLRRPARARRLGLHLAAPVALAIALPWLAALFARADHALLCSALSDEAGRGFPTNTEIADHVRWIGYGMIPWMAFLPTGVLRLTASGDDRRGLVVPLLSLAAAALGVALSGGLPGQTLLLAAIVAIAVVAAAGLALPGPDAIDAHERVACMVGAMLVVVVLKDLAAEPELLPALALPEGARVHVGASRLPVFGAALSPLALGALALGGWAPGARWPAMVRRALAAASRHATALAAAVGAVTALLTLVSGLRGVTAAASWSDVFETYADVPQAERGPIVGWREVGAGARFYAGREIEVVERAGQLRRLLSDRSGPVYFATRTSYYRQLSDVINRMSGDRIRALNEHRQHHVLAVYDGPDLSTVRRPSPVIGALPEHVRQRRDESLGGGAVELLGATIAAEHAHPGDTIAVELFFRCARAMTQDHQVRLRVRLRDGDWSHAEAHDPADAALPTSEWQPGEIVVDRAELALPADAPAGRHILEVDLAGAGGPRRELGSIRVE